MERIMGGMIFMVGKHYEGNNGQEIEGRLNTCRNDNNSGCCCESFYLLLEGDWGAVWTSTTFVP
jgi:hypothetical protein